MSKSKLAVALGVKAAHNEWIVMVNADCRPQSDLWLKTLASRMDSDANLVAASTWRHQHYRMLFAVKRTS